MAQWAWGFSGNTHETRVAEAEAALRSAVAALRSVREGNGPSQATSNVHRLAGRLLSARVRMLKARVNTLQDSSAKETGAVAPQEFAALRARLAAVQQAGIAGILAEFDVDSG